MSIQQYTAWNIHIFPELCFASLPFQTFGCWRTFCMTKGEDAHGPGSDRCSRANQIVLGSYWGRSMHTISSGPTRDTTHSHPLIKHWPLPSAPGFPAESPESPESPTASSRLLGCLPLDSASLHQIVSFRALRGHNHTHMTSRCLKINFFHATRSGGRLSRIPLTGDPSQETQGQQLAII